MNFTALRDSIIQPGSGDTRSSCLGGSRTPYEELKIGNGPSSKPPFLTKLAATDQIVLVLLDTQISKTQLPDKGTGKTHNQVLS